MTDIEILSKVFNMYVDHSYRQREIAERLGVSVTDIGYLLRSLGFYQCKLISINHPEILLRKDPYIKTILGRIRERNGYSCS